MIKAPPKGRQVLRYQARLRAGTWLHAAAVFCHVVGRVRDISTTSLIHRFHAVGGGVPGGDGRHNVGRLPEALAREIGQGGSERVVLGVVEHLSRGGVSRVGLGCGLLGLKPLRQERRDRYRGKDADDDDHRIVAKLQTQGNSDFVLYSPRAASTA
jgi:hypothetical protein